jgi:hypothetical protein
MKKGISVLTIVVLLSTLLTSCDLAAGIFKAGMLVTVIIIVVVVAVVFWLINKIRK